MSHILDAIRDDNPDVVPAASSSGSPSSSQSTRCWTSAGRTA